MAIRGTVSSHSLIKFGVPQGLILGPILSRCICYHLAALSIYIKCNSTVTLMTHSCISTPLQSDKLTIRYKKKMDVSYFSWIKWWNWDPYHWSWQSVCFWYFHKTGTHNLFHSKSLLFPLFKFWIDFITLWLKLRDRASCSENHAHRREKTIVTRICNQEWKH